MNSISKPAYRIFDRNLKKIQRNQAASDIIKSRNADYLKDEVADRLVDRLLFIKREFETVLDLGAGCGHFAKSLNKSKYQPPPIKTLIMTDISSKMLNRDSVQYPNLHIERKEMDEEIIQFEENKFDAVVCNLSMHWINDLPGCLIQIQRSLKPDCPFLGAMFGGDTLFELRTSLQLAEMERMGGISPRVSPMTEVRDMGSLMSRAGFKLNTIDVDEIIVDFPDIFTLMRNLQEMGENNAVLSRHHILSRDVLLAAQAIYKQLHGNKDGSIPATFSVIYMIGWKEAEGQPRPLERASAKTNLKDVL
ncbi:NADH dehydrogenase [ubiquinone] 1 alpha subcomplex assembly factor 5 [Neolecta irregularis DAH-3]|uniref:NADH dehydrogenase [ubiquinone] 1 alpha subcomplex assembly factor 5 n=1 Tax=Neolecta irregularis (strain DAH-3) TaxID=1198029 RepID=A0A1U7LLG7_NEOID|nr:NADH dehydrogenase [ubiquinone] 1 alpha subcomplex assembly factor 5 [Neolecta irregularis DAH-3]|eukprot:OLL23489.1 NADH dehydrogenase [ubiquinone] 1 alpha subcomplex assembly factor 5 [Neolecta irregularis DAH-3]